MIINLLAAHGLRFKIQARGNRLLAGLAVIAAGIGVTWCVIHGLDTVDAGMLWNGMKLGLAALLAVTVYKLVTLDWSRRLELGLLSVATVVEGSLLGWLLYHSDFVPDNSSMRILWQLVQGGAAGLVLLAGCALAFKKRAGVVLIHAGIALMMFNELYVGMTSQEAQMRHDSPAPCTTTSKTSAPSNWRSSIRRARRKTMCVVIPKEILRPGRSFAMIDCRSMLRSIKFMQNAGCQV